MVIKKWMCNVCSSHFVEKDLAENCEKDHLTIFDASLSQLKFNPDSHYSYDKKVPNEVVIRFSERHEDFGIYELKQVGRKKIK